VHDAPVSTLASTTTRPIRRLAVGLAAAAVLAACGSTGSGGAAATSTTPTTAAVASSTTAGTAPTTGGPSTAPTSAGSVTSVASTAPTTAPRTTAAPSGGCRSGTPNAVPAGAAHQVTFDLDGDGKADTLWVDAPKSGGERMGVVTAAGGGSSIALGSASPIPESAFVVDADGKAPLEILTSDGRVGGLYAFVGCRLQTVANKQGKPYTFDLGFGDYGTGVGCNTIGGVRYLTGLGVKSDDGTTVKWTRTEIVLDGLHARNGSTQSGTFTRPRDAHAIELLHTLSCGTRTITANGITVPE